MSNIKQSDVRRSIEINKQYLMICSLYNLSREQFFYEVKQLKKSDYGNNTLLENTNFGKKFPELTNGVIANYSTKSSFLGSHRKATNENYFNYYNSEALKDFAIDNREGTIFSKREQNIQRKKGIEKSKKIIKKPTKILKDKPFVDIRTFDSTNISNIRNLTNVNDLKVVKESNYFGTQQVNIAIEYYVIDKYGNIYPNRWISFSSGLSAKKILLDLYDKVYDDLVDWFESMEQSEFQVIIVNENLKVYRYADPKVSNQNKRGKAKV